MRPLVTLIITTAIDTTTRLLCVREVFEETEEPYVQWVEAAPVVPVVETTTAIERPKRLVRNMVRSDGRGRLLPASGGYTSGCSSQDKPWSYGNVVRDDGVGVVATANSTLHHWR